MMGAEQIMAKVKSLETEITRSEMIQEQQLTYLKSTHNVNSTEEASELVVSISAGIEQLVARKTTLLEKLQGLTDWTKV
jgi:hypothetical protein